jgi:hypothetical protein
MRRLVVPSFLAILAACDVGTLDVGGADANGNINGADANPNIQCVNAKTPLAAHHNAGTQCSIGGCHGNPVGAGAPLYSIAGTAYLTTGVPAAGATIVIPGAGAGGIDLELTVAQDGNFYSEELAPPLTGGAPRASKCPDDRAMPSAATTGNCNSCHGNGASAGPITLQ